MRIILFVSFLITCVSSIQGDGDNINTVLADINKRLDEKDARISKLEAIFRVQDVAMQAQQNTIKLLKDEVAVQKATIQLLQGRPQNFDQEIRQRKNHIDRAETRTPVAFLATLTGHAEHLGADQIIEFDAVTTNIGEAYNPHVGVFTAPLSGIYIFSTTILSYVSTNSHFVIKNNGEIVTRLFYHGAALQGYDTTSNTIVIELSAGDDVTVVNVDSNKNIHGSQYTTFSGFLLQELYETSVTK